MPLDVDNVDAVSNYFFRSIDDFDSGRRHVSQLPI